ncbi:sensor histidine kinase [Sabulibacter ruber]|uniref:sensor histidine kinase n=1 Tax=Sabulibacter ruber TaxID=2811901 RepID=UPI001A96B925|nr:sensor histidine kinase [Sabulibacter ruber]
MYDLLLIVTLGTALMLALGMLIFYLMYAYQKRRSEHSREIGNLEAAFQRELLKAQVEVQEQTFLSISQEIHDNVGQVLSLVRLHVSTLESAGSVAREQKIRSSKELLDQAIEDLRNLSKRLNSRYIAQQSLAALLRFQLDLIGKTGALATSFEVEGKEAGLDPERKLIILRIAQEALNNVLRHAEAGSVTVRLRYPGGRVSLSIEDDGKGFDAAALPSPQGTGSSNMRYRASLLGATLHVHSTPGGGTSVFFELPFP